MIRVGVNGLRTYVLMRGRPNTAPQSMDLTEAEAADLHAQLGMILPEALLNVELGHADPSEDEMDAEIQRLNPTSGRR